VVASVLLERCRYREHPPRHQYVPTARGRDFRPVLLALLAWGNRHFAPEGASVQLLDATTGAVADPILVDRVTGLPITESDHRLAPGPAAPERTRLRYASTGRAATAQKRPQPRRNRAAGQRGIG
jgi:hypothetical protein